MLLQTLARPEERSSFRKAALTCFFRVKPAELVQTPDVPMQHPARRLYQTWLGYVENRQWSSLFQSLLHDTGLLFANSSPLPLGEGVTKVRVGLLDGRTPPHDSPAIAHNAGNGQARQTSICSACSTGYAPAGALRVNEADLQPVELSRPKVKIVMTIHASKGLEFYPFKCS